MPNPMQPRRYSPMAAGAPPGMPPGPPPGMPPGPPPGLMGGMPPGGPFPGGGPPQFQPPASEMSPEQLSREFLVHMLRQKPSPESGATTPRPFVPPVGTGNLGGRRTG